MNPLEEFYARKAEHIRALGEDRELKEKTHDWMLHTSRYFYTYNFTWLGVPVIQFPQDLLALQEIIWQVKPDLIVETGIAHGGSLIFSASMLELIGGDGEVLGIDIDIRAHNRTEIEKHPLARRISMIEGSSIAPEVAAKVLEKAQGKRQVMVVLDSNHTHEHVSRELELYSPLVKNGSYLVVFDTMIEDLPEDFSTGRSWGKGNNPKTAVWEFLKTSDRFVIDKDLENKILITPAPDGYLRCVKD
jgi:cephalosporin hydroxylase